MLPHPLHPALSQYPLLDEGGIGGHGWLIDLEHHSLPKLLRSFCDITVVPLSFHHPCTLPLIPFTLSSPSHVTPPIHYGPLAHQNSDTENQPGWPEKGRGSRARKHSIEDCILLLLCSSMQQSQWGIHCVLRTHARPWTQEVDLGTGWSTACCLFSFTEKAWLW